ncbi:Phage major capsid protein [Nitrospira tepida]|uniref:Phage major capsid protein n=1 Tax=Nitrospira tepida TaxID=2973512 RepID=A0AA86N063_9BACT|nr:phage major capsid protein [Nitrospira tepida]CAI4032318.1 Phage major capsid protein [Nitrospira tepida]
MSSFTRAQQLREQRGRLLDEAQALLKREPFTKQIEARFDGIMVEVDRLAAQIREAELGDALTDAGRRDPKMDRILRGLSSRPGLSEDEGEPEVRAFSNFLKFGINGLDPDERAIMTKRLRHDPDIRMAQGVGSGGAGGYAVPDAAMAPLVEALKQIGGVLPNCTIVPSATGADLPIPADNETAVEGEIISENTQHNEGDVVLSQVVLQSFLYSSKIVRVSIQLMDDAGFDFAAYVMKKLGERLGRITAKHWVTGDGSSKPRGIVTAATVGKTAASATAVTYDELVDHMHSVDPLYRQNGKWLMNDTTFGALRKLKDSQNRPLYGDLAAGSPDSLLGKPVVIDPNMPSLATGNKAILFGDLSAYYVRLVKEPRVLRLEERYADYLQLGFLAFIRADGDLVDGGGGAVKALQMA